MDEAGNTKDDLSLPKGTDDAEKLAQQIQEDFDAGKELVVTVLKVSSSLCNFCKTVHSSHPSHQWMLKASSQRQRQPLQGHSCMAQQTQQHCCNKFMGKAYTEYFSFRCILDSCSDSSGINQGWSSCAHSSQALQLIYALYCEFCMPGIAVGLHGRQNLT